MAYNLGRANFILDANIQPLLQAEAIAYNKTTTNAEALTATLAKQLKIREKDVTNSASKILTENAKAAKAIVTADKAAAEDRKKTTQELLKVEQAAANERKKITQETVKYYKEQEAQRLADEKKAAADRARDLQAFAKVVQANQKAEAAERTATARRIQAEEKKIEQERLASVRQNLAQEATLRRQANARRIAEAKATAAEEKKATAAASSGLFGQGGILGTGLTGGNVATLLGFGAIASTAVIARAAVVGLNEAVLAQEQAQRALQASFGDTAEGFKKLADDTAAAFNKQSSAIELGVARFGVLRNQYGLTEAETQKLIKITLDLHGAFGGDIDQIFKDVSNAIQGETQALEKYGIVLQANAIKNSADLTEEQKRLYESMGNIEASHVRLQVLQARSAQYDGQAKKRVDELAGAFDLWKRNVDLLTVSLGKSVAPAENFVIRGAAEMVGAINKFLEKKTEYEKALDDLRKKQETPAVNNEQSFIGGILSSLDKLGRSTLAGSEARNEELDNDIRRRLGIPTKQQIDEQIEANKRVAASEEELNKKRLANANALNDAQKSEQARLEAINTRQTRQVEGAIANARELAEAEIAALDKRIEVAHFAQDEELRIAKHTSEAQIKALEEVEYARKRASEAELRRIEQERDDKIKAADDVLDSTLSGITIAKDAAHEAAAEQIRQAEIQKDKLLKAAETRRDVELDRLEQEKRDRDHARTKEDDAAEDANKKVVRRLEDTHKRVLRNLDDEADAAREKDKQIISGIDDRIDAEDERHRKATQNIDDEKQQQLDAIDAQIQALDYADKARDNAKRLREANDKVSEAQQKVIAATGTGTPQQVVDARGKLTAAIRIGDPTAVKKAQDELTAITGQGAKAILEAQKELADAQSNLIDDNVKQTNDAAKDKLQAEKTRITAEADAEKRQEDDRNRKRKDRLDKDKQAEKDRLDTALKAIDKRKDAENDQFENSKRKQADSVEAQKRKIGELRKFEDEANKDAIEATRKKYDAERDEIDATYTGEEHGIIPAIRRATVAADNGFKAQEDSARKAHKAIRDEIDETYNDKNTGLIAVHQRAEEAAVHEHSVALAAARAHYEAEQEKIKDTYTGPNGIITRLQHLKTDTKTALDDVIAEYEKLKKGLVGDDGIFPTTFDAALKQLDQFIKDFNSRGGLTIPVNVAIPHVDYEDQHRSPSNTVTSGGSGNGGSTVVPPAREVPGAPSPGGTAVTGPINVGAGKFINGLGFKAKYNSHHTAGRGWESDGNIAAWEYGPTRHKGQDLILAQGGIGTPIGAFAPGRVAQTFTNYTGAEPGGKYVVVQEPSGLTHWYMHLNKVSVGVGQQVGRGDQIGEYGNTGTEDVGAHLHFEVRDGLNNGSLTLNDLLAGRGSLDPSRYIRGYDTGNLFKYPTLTYDTVTGQQGVLAERGPERLLGRAQTAAFDRMPILQSDMVSIGAMLNNSIGSSAISGGDSFSYVGVAPESIFTQFRDDQRRQRVLRGIR